MPSSKSSSQRRGKTATTTASDGGKASSSSSSSSSSSTKNTAAVNDQLAAQLERATAQLSQSRTNMQALHRMWETYLTVISYIVMAISLHQAYVVMNACREDIDAVNGLETNASIAKEQALLIVARDAAVPILGVVMACFLTLYLRLVQGKNMNQTSKAHVLAHPLFLTAQACMVPMLLLYFEHQRLEKSATNMGDNDRIVWQSCLAGHASLTNNNDTIDLPSAHESNILQRPLPSAIVLNGIVALSLWMMQRQRAYLTKSANSVSELQQELLGSGSDSGGANGASRTDKKTQ